MTPLQAALRVLSSQQETALIDEHYANAPAVGQVNDQGRGLLKELVWGVIRQRGTLDHLLDRFLPHPDRIPREVREILRLGAYQLLFLDHTPDHAAINETVELTRWAGRKKLVKLVNAVLRRLQSMGTPSYPDLASAHSHPDWLVERWVARDGKDVTEARLLANNRRPVLTLRINRRQISRDDYLALLGAAGHKASAGPLPPSILVESGGAPALLPGYAAGQFFCQDLSAMAVAPLVEAETGMRVLEIAAAPGGKTTHLLELVDDLQLFALDAKRGRLARLEQNLQRLSLEGARLLVGRGDALPLGPGTAFDRVLLDVPCSNTGVLARRIDARWRLRAGDISQLAQLQGRMLRCAAPQVAVSGKLIYSTCSIESEENEQRIAHFLQSFPGFEVELQQTFLPEKSWPGAGGFVARLVRIY